MSIEYDENTNFESNSTNSNDSTPSAQNGSQSRSEAILQAIVNGSGSSQLPVPKSRVEELLLQVLQVIENGGGGGSGGSALPVVTTSDNGKVLRVVNGSWAAAALPNASGVSF